MKTIHVNPEALNHVAIMVRAQYESNIRVQKMLPGDSFLKRDEKLLEEFLNAVDAGERMTVSHFMGNDKTETIEPGKAG